jgi:hypothetical protein
LQRSTGPLKLACSKFHALPLALPQRHTYSRATRGAEEKKKSDAPTYLPFLRFFEIFRSEFRKYFYGVFGLPMQRNGQNAIKKIDGKIRKEKRFFFSQLFRPKAFDMDFLQKVLYGVFELPLLRNAQKRHKKINKIKIFKKRYLHTPFAICQIYVAFNFIFLRRPSRATAILLCYQSGGVQL